VKDKKRTTATKPKALPKPVKRRMYAVVNGSGVLMSHVFFDPPIKAPISKGLVPVLVTVTPIRAKRAGGKGKR
jgi:hypothetical protein